VEPYLGTVRGQTEPVLSVESERFDELVAEALDGVPGELLALMTNVVVLVEDEPPDRDDADPLGLYEGIPLTERDGWYSGVLPDRITIYRGPVVRRCASWAEAVDEIRITVVHEIAHHFGIDDDRLAELGYD